MGWDMFFGLGWARSRGHLAGWSSWSAAGLVLPIQIWFPRENEGNPWPSAFLIFFSGFTEARAARGLLLCGQLSAGGARPPGASERPAALPPEGEA